MFTTSTALPCSYVGGAPSVDDLLDDLVERTKHFDLIVIASVDKLKDQSNLIVIESFKGGLVPKQILAYRQATSCDVHFHLSQDRLIMFGSYVNDRLHINDADGTIGPDHPRYDEAIVRLRELFPNDA